MTVVAKDAGMTLDAARGQMSTMTFPSAAEQLEKYFNENGLASAAIAVVGNAFATAENPALEDYSVAIDTSFLK